MTRPIGGSFPEPGGGCDMTRSLGAEAIARERARQVDFEGWTPEHDLVHADGELRAAASAYLASASARLDGADGEMAAVVGTELWPWAPVLFKPHGEVRDLVRAGALICAELDRLHALGAVIE